VAALRAAVRGARTCCIEANQIGGTCLNVGCIPTKAMLHASEFYYGMRHGAQFGFQVGHLALDGAAFMARVTRLVEQLRGGVEQLVSARRIDVIRGRGRLTSPDTIAVEAAGGPREITAKSIIIATGTRPARPGFLPWDSGRILTSDEATTAAALPDSVIIMGGGVTGCEFATVYSELGIPVTIIEMMDRLVPPLDEDVSKMIRRSLLKRGVKVMTSAKIAEVRLHESGIIAQLESGQSISAACLLVGTGRVPLVEGIGLEAAGVRVENGIIPVDDHCRTNVSGLYAVGDVAERRQYAHLASRMGIIAADNATGHENSDPRTIVPAGVFTHPEIAMVGLTEAEARRVSPARVRVARYPYSASGIAHAYGDPEGMVKIVGDESTGKILGAVVIGQHAADVLQQIVTVMRNDLTVAQLAETIQPHPTFAEGVLEAADAWLGLPLHTLH
jgi:dihydrolipoamide dehydrogenase